MVSGSPCLSVPWVSGPQGLIKDLRVSRSQGLNGRNVLSSSGSQVTQSLRYLKGLKPYGLRVLRVSESHGSRRLWVLLRASLEGLKLSESQRSQCLRVSRQQGSQDIKGLSAIWS